MPLLEGRIAIVTGASRGAGRGIALVLGQEGATVYVTGRSVQGEPTTDNLSGTIDQTAEEIAARGGIGIPVRCDHTVDAQVEALFERVKQEQGRLDILVNNAWGGYEGHDETFGAPFWEQPLWRWDKMLTVGVRSDMVTSYFAVPLMIPQRQGLIINTTIDVGSQRNWDPGKHDRLNVFYDTVKTAVNRMAFGMAHNLRPYGITVLAVAPGWMRTEAVMSGKPPHTRPSADALDQTESVEYIGQAVVALAADPNVMDKTGCVLRVGALAREYGFTDVDGRQWDWYSDR
jgi:NAD(P)-dependent dehydrogenase (short-subunit alcohol dehydrogenase family)